MTVCGREGPEIVKISVTYFMDGLPTELFMPYVVLANKMKMQTKMNILSNIWASNILLRTS